jgi:phosphonate C-P lyase system protein PhnG
MDKRSLSRIMNFADTALLRDLAERAAGGREALILKPAEKTLALVHIREPAQGGCFFLGEALVAHCIVELGGVRGAAVQLGDDLGRVQAAAMLDAAHSGGFAEFTLVLPQLLALEAERAEALEREAELVRGTAVQFQSLEDREL